MIETFTHVQYNTEVYGLTNQPAPFDFIIDMVPDQDGLAYLKPVASVFYYPRKESFDYQLDYSKDDIIREVKSERDRIEKLKQERKAAEEKAKGQ